MAIVPHWTTINIRSRIFQVHVFRNYTRKIPQAMILFISTIRLLYDLECKKYELSRQDQLLPPRIPHTAWFSTHRNRTISSAVQMKPESCILPGRSESWNIQVSFPCDAWGHYSQLVAEALSKSSKINHYRDISTGSAYRVLHLAMLPKIILLLSPTASGFNHASYPPASTYGLPGGSLRLCNRQVPPCVFSYLTGELKRSILYSKAHGLKPASESLL